MFNRPNRTETAPQATLIVTLGLLILLAWPAFAVFGDGAADTGEPILIEIQVEGNTRTQTEYVLREMGLQTGQPLSRDRLDEVWDHLEDLGCFAYVDMEYDDFEPGEVILIVTLEEEDTVGWGPLFRFDQRHKYLAGGYVENTHLRGRGETLRADFSLLYIQRAKLKWTRPWFLRQRGLEAGVALQAEQANYVYRPFRYRKSALDLSLRWAARQPFFAAVHLEGATYDQRDDFSWPAPRRGDNSAPAVMQYEGGAQSWLVPSLEVGIDTRSNPLYPSRGVYGNARIRQWSSSDFDSYTESSLDLRGFLPLPLGHHLLAVRAWGRTTNGATHLDNLYFMGGAQTVRGHDPATREGDEAYLVTLEYRLPITMMRISPQGDLAGVGLHVFGDAGDTWYHGADPTSALQSWGAGIHLNLDKLQVRFEAARTDSGAWTFEFGDVMTF